MSAKYRSELLKTLAILIAAVLSICFTSVSGAADFIQLPDASKVDLSQKCPVCGMEVGGKDRQPVTVTYKDGRVAGFHGVAAAVFKDGRVVGFEGARCLFIYNSVPEKYGVNVADIAHQYVTDFVTKRMIELPRAFLVLGSNVKGPMGYDLVPFGSKEEAAQFASANDGKWIVQLHEVARTAQKQTDATDPAQTPGTSGRDENKPPIGVPGSGPTQSLDRGSDRPMNSPGIQPEQQFIQPAPRGGGGC